MNPMHDAGGRAACLIMDPDELFGDNSAQQHAKGTCAGCPIQTACLAYALDERIEHGLWGGMTERERRALLRRRPAVTSWRALLQAQAALAQAPSARPGPAADTLPLAS